MLPLTGRPQTFFAGRGETTPGTEHARGRTGRWLVMGGLVAGSLLALTATARAEGQSSFEELQRAASPVGDLVSGLRSPESAEACGKAPSERERARCRVVRRYLLKTLPSHPLRKVSDDPEAITLSDFDGSIKGYHLAVAGCLACRQPVALGGGHGRLVTVGLLDKAQKGALKDAVPLSRNAVSFASLPEAKRWLATNKNALRAEFVFLPVQETWKRGDEQGVSLAKVGVRVFNRCTGEVLVSQPPSRGPVDVGKNVPGCEVAAGNKKDPANDGGGEASRERLSRSDIADVMEKIRAPVSACYAEFHQPGQVDLAFVVAPSGLVQAVTVQGLFQGTPTGACATNAAKSARFPSFEGTAQEFRYPFFLR